jgi:hypothetical protein
LKDSGDLGAGGNATVGGGVKVGGKVQLASAEVTVDDGKGKPYPLLSRLPGDASVGVTDRGPALRLKPCHVVVEGGPLSFALGGGAGGQPRPVLRLHRGAMGFSRFELLDGNGQAVLNARYDQNGRNTYIHLVDNRGKAICGLGMENGNGLGNVASGTIFLNTHGDGLIQITNHQPWGIQQRRSSSASPVCPG